MKVVIISHTEHYLNDKNEIVGWASTIEELNNLIKVVTEIIHIAPLHKNKAPKSTLPYNSIKIKHIPIKKSGGKGMEKISILKNMFHNLKTINKYCKDADYIQFRAPTGIGIYVLPYLKFFNKSNYWIKYAGNWKDKNMSIGNKLQKIWIKNILSVKTKVTLNGFWKGERKNIIPFENPTLKACDRTLGKEIVFNKKINKKKVFSFVGALNEHKGVDVILKVFSEIDSENIDSIHFIGDGNKKDEYIKLSKNLNYKTFFYGFLPKNEIKKVYEKSDFILLPSKSEGFPKVIAEAMNFGCIPIVSNVSCIDQYIKSNENGYLINPPFSYNLKENIFKAINLNNNTFKKWIEYNYNCAEKFTYEYYNYRIINEIFK